MRLPDAERIDGKADDKEARDRRQERMVALQIDCHEVFLMSDGQGPHIITGNAL